MRAVVVPLVLGGALLGAGCTSWAPVRPGEPVDASRGLFLVTEQRAVVLGDVDQVGTGTGAIVGVVVDGCVADGRPLDRGALVGTDAPARTCELLAWPPTRTGVRSEVPLSGIVEARVQEVDVDATVTFVAGSALVLAGLTLGFFVFALTSQTSIEGRPLRDRRGRATQAARIATADWARGAGGLPTSDCAPDSACASSPASSCASTTDLARAEAWTTVAQNEHASVAAFSRLALQLTALGSPPDLLRRTLAASIQEIEHARLCFAVASRYAGAPVGPGPLPEALDTRPTDLEALAIESLLDGCLGEGLAAALAHAASAHATDRAIEAVLIRLARDEVEHAELAWSVIEWCLARGGPGLRAELLTALESAPVPRAGPLPEYREVAVAPLFEALRGHARQRLAQPTAR